jgi:hypothetical protein
MKSQLNWLCSLLALASMTSSSIALAANHGGLFLKSIPYGGSRVVPTRESVGVSSTKLHASTVDKSRAATDSVSQVGYYCEKDLSYSIVKDDSLRNLELPFPQTLLIFVPLSFPGQGSSASTVPFRRYRRWSQSFC